MSLQSELLRDDPRLQSCLTHDASHLVKGTVGSCVARVQTALFVVDGLKIEREEIHSKLYGSSTANAELAFKTRRKIINRKYQTKPDNIVGKMTIAALDKELLKKEGYADCQQTYCGNNPDGMPHTQDKDGMAHTQDKFTSPVRLVRGPGVSGGVSAAEVAKTRAPGGIVAVTKSRSVVGRLLAFHRHPSLPIPPGILVEFDFLWSYFGMPKFPLRNPLTKGQVNDLETFLLVVDGVLEGMATNWETRRPCFATHRDCCTRTRTHSRSQACASQRSPPRTPDGRTACTLIPATCCMTATKSVL
jgi:hypothetical protein